MENTDQELALARVIAEKVSELGGRVYYVGGFVRDSVQSIPNHDVDIEVHGISAAALESVLDCLGSRLEMGRSFGIYALKGYNLDIALPRNAGQRDTDPYVGTLRAAGRRDFTCNALMQDVLTGEITDHFGGLADLECGILRHTNPVTFVQDPLRVLRCARFAARFGFAVAPETAALCAGIDLTMLPRERIFEELSRALLQTAKPSAFFRVLRQLGQLDTWFPELKQLIGVEQNPAYHAEGDVWNHTMLVLDAAADYRNRVQNPLGLMLGALIHDFGKALCTQTVNGAIRSIGHESIGLPMEETFLTRLTGDRKLKEYALNLSRLHMKPNVAAANGASVKSTNKLFDEAVDPEALICIALSDSRGRILKNGSEDNEAFLRARLETYREYMSRPYVMGKDLIDAGLAPSAEFAGYLSYAHKLRLAGIDRESALKQTLAMAGKKERKRKTEAREDIRDTALMFCAL